MSFGNPEKPHQTNFDETQQKPETPHDALRSMTDADLSAQMAGSLQGSGNGKYPLLYQEFLRRYREN